MSEIEICQCSEEEREHFGVRRGSNSYICKNCKLPTSTEEDGFVDAGPTRFSLTHNNLEEQEKLINELIVQMATNGKYKKALQEGKFASFSLTGTNDWEDYASSVFRIIMLKELMRISKSVEKLANEVEKLRDSRE